MSSPSIIALDCLSELSDESLMDEVVHLCGHMNAADYRLCVLIQELTDRNCWNRYGCSAVQWLNYRCGISAGAARERIRVAKALADLPLLTEAFRAGELSYSKVRAVTRVARHDNEASLVNIARYTTAGQSERIFRKYRKIEDSMEAKRSFDSRKVSCSRDEDGCWVIRARLLPDQGALVAKAIQLVCNKIDPDVEESADGRRADALTYLAEHFLGSPEAPPAKADDHHQVVVHVSAETLSERLDVPEPDGGMSGAEIEDGGAISAQAARRISCDSGVIPLVESKGEPLALGRKRRLVSPALRRALKSRDGGCQYPGCTHTHWVDAHHIQHWADGGETKLDNLVLLCRRHHRLIHEGGATLTHENGELVFRNAHGVLLERCAARFEGRFRGNVVELSRQHEAMGLSIDKRTAAGRWDGEPLDYEHIFFVLFQHHGRPKAA